MRTEEFGGVEEELSEYAVPRMDCPSEERAVRLALDGKAYVHGLSFDLPGRRLVVRHERGRAPEITSRLEPLGFGASLVRTWSAKPSDVQAQPVSGETGEARTLWILLAINGAMFVAEVIAGFLAQSAGLLADSLDMLADAFVYGLSLYAVGRAATHQLRAAKASGILQLLLALGALFEVVRRWVAGSDPEPGWMLSVAAVALAANVTCLALVFRHRAGGAHMKASYIFSTNDVLANVGVIIAGGLVAWTNSSVPDLIVGTIIGLVVLGGAIRILRLRA